MSQVDFQTHGENYLQEHHNNRVEGYRNGKDVTIIVMNTLKTLDVTAGVSMPHFKSLKSYADNPPKL